MKKTISRADLPVEKQRELEREERRRARLAVSHEKGKAKAFSKMSRAEKDELLFALLLERGYVEE